MLMEDMTTHLHAFPLTDCRSARKLLNGRVRSSPHDSPPINVCSHSGALPYLVGAVPMHLLSRIIYPETSWRQEDRRQGRRRSGFSRRGVNVLGVEVLGRGDSSDTSQDEEA